MAKPKEVVKERYSGTANPATLKDFREYCKVNYIPVSIQIEQLMEAFNKKNKKYLK